MKKNRQLLKILTAATLIGANVLAISSALAEVPILTSSFIIHNKTKNWYLQLYVQPVNDYDFHGTMQVGSKASDIADQPPRIPPGGDGTLTIKSPQIHDYEQIDARLAVGSTAEPWTFGKDLDLIARKPDPGVYLISPCVLHLKYGMLESTTGDGRAVLETVSMEKIANMYPRILITCEKVGSNGNEVEVADL